MTKFASIALSTLLLLAGAAAAKPPTPAALDGAPVVHDLGVQPLPEADLADVVGAGWWYDACVVGRTVAGHIWKGLSLVTPTPLDDALSHLVIVTAPAFCA